MRDSLPLYETIPAAPVEGQATSCAIDLSDELLGGVRSACMKGRHVERRRCCPVLAAWLMAARSRTSLHPPILTAGSASAPLPSSMSATTLPLLPDDSLVCISSLKSALAARGIHLTPPNATCDVVTCLCGIHLSHLSAQSCPLPFFWNHGRSNATAAASSSSSAAAAASSSSAAAAADFRLHSNAAGSSAAAGVASPAPTPSGLSNLLQALASNCTDHSYRGCTRCLRTLRKEVSGMAAPPNASAATPAGKVLNCELVGLMWLLELNKTFYIPTVSAVVRALMYGDHETASTPKSKWAPPPKCSPDTENMPLALDYSELLTTASSSTASATRSPSKSAAAEAAAPPLSAAAALLILFSLL